MKRSDINPHEPKKLNASQVKVLEIASRGELVVVWWVHGKFRKPHFSLTGGKIRNETMFGLWLAGYIEQAVLGDRIKEHKLGLALEADRAKITKRGLQVLDEFRKSRESPDN